METEFNGGGNPSLEILGQLVRARKILHREEKQLGEENSIPIFFCHPFGLG